MATLQRNPRDTQKWKNWTVLTLIKTVKSKYFILFLSVIIFLMILSTVTKEVKLFNIVNAQNAETKIDRKAFLNDLESLQICYNPIPNDSYCLSQLSNIKDKISKTTDKFDTSIVLGIVLNTYSYLDSVKASKSLDVHKRIVKNSVVASNNNLYPFNAKPEIFQADSKLFYEKQVKKLKD